MYKVNLNLGSNSQSMRQSTLPFKKEQKVPKRDDRFKRKGPATRGPKPLSNHKDDPVEVLSDRTSTPDKKATKRGGPQAKRDKRSDK